MKNNKIPSFDAYLHLHYQGTIEFTTKNRKGEITSKKELPMHSPSANFFRVLRATFAGVLSGALIRFNGTAITPSSGSGSAGRITVVSGAGELWGLRAGTGTTAQDIEDFSLATPIAHGTGVGELSHLATTVTQGEKSIECIRGFENLSGASITINELAITARSAGDGTSYTQPYMFTRDLLSTPLVIPDNQIGTIKVNFFVSEGTRNVNAFFDQYAATTSDSSTTMYHGTGTLARVPWLIQCNGAVGEDVKGILLGTGDTAIDYLDIDLATRIAQGDGAGQLLYGLTETDAITYNSVDNSLEFMTSRTITNSSGGPITVREMGIFGNSAFTTQRYLWYRFLLPAPITFADGEMRQARIRCLYTLT